MQLFSCATLLANTFAYAHSCASSYILLATYCDLYTCLYELTMNGRLRLVQALPLGVGGGKQHSPGLTSCWPRHQTMYWYTYHYGCLMDSIHLCVLTQNLAFIIYLQYPVDSAFLGITFYHFICTLPTPPAASILIYLFIAILLLAPAIILMGRRLNI